MRATWRLAANNLAGRPVRAGLLIAAVASAVMMMVAVASLLETIDRTHQRQVGRMLGQADLRLIHRFNQRLPESLAADIAAWPQTLAVATQFEHTLTLRNPRTGRSRPIQCMGVEPERDAQLRPVEMIAGSPITGPDQIVLDQEAADRLDAQVGDQLNAIHFGPPTQFTVTGIYARPTLGLLQRPQGMIQLAQAQSLGGLAGYVDQIEIRLRPGHDASAVQRQYADTLPPTVLFQSTAAGSTQTNRSLAVARLMLLHVAIQVAIAAAFIIAVSLSTAVTEKLRELAMLRAIGATRWQIGVAQLLSGVMLTGTGMAIGAPLGLTLAYGVYRHFADTLNAGFDPAWAALALAATGALAVGVASAIAPAIAASRATPVAGLAARARQPRRWQVLVCLALGLLLTAGPMAALLMPLDAETVFWFYPLAGVPMLMTGWFLLGTPLILALNLALAPAMARALRLPATLLAQGNAATPFRNGFMAATMMIALAMLINIWTGGRGFLGGWFDRIQIPDAFVHSATPIPPAQLDALRALDSVTDLCRITAFPVPTLGSPRPRPGRPTATPPAQTLFVACDMASFFRMADLVWVQGDATTAMAELEQGQAVLVSQEFFAAHGLGHGQQVTLLTVNGPATFRIAGVIASPGVDVAVQFYGVQRNYASASVGSLIGTHADAIAHWQVDAANLVLLSVKPDVADATVLQQIRQAIPGVVRGSSRRIRQNMHKAIDQLMLIASSVAVVALGIAAVAVGNLILADIHGRRFEFGVLRSVGAAKPMLARLILGQTAIIALTGCVMGLGMGVQLAMISEHLYDRLLGIGYPLAWPWDVIAYGSLALVAASLLAATPAVVQLLRMHPRDLLAIE